METNTLRNVIVHVRRTLITPKVALLCAVTTVLFISVLFSIQSHTHLPLFKKPLSNRMRDEVVELLRAADIPFHLRDNRILLTKEEKAKAELMFLTKGRMPTFSYASFDSAACYDFLPRAREGSASRAKYYTLLHGLQEHLSYFSFLANVQVALSYPEGENAHAPTLYITLTYEKEYRAFKNRRAIQRGLRRFIAKGVADVAISNVFLRNSSL